MMQTYRKAIYVLTGEKKRRVCVSDVGNIPNLRCSRLQRHQNFAGKTEQNCQITKLTPWFQIYWHATSKTMVVEQCQVWGKSGHQPLLFQWLLLEELV
jgi:hypothetical protein